MLTTSWIEFVLTRREHCVYLIVTKFLHIGIQGSRIGFKVTVVIKLQGVDKDTHHHPISHLHCFLNQAQMPGVKITHGRNKRNLHAGLMPATRTGLHFSDRIDKLHA